MDEYLDKEFHSLLGRMRKLKIEMVNISDELDECYVDLFKVIDGLYQLLDILKTNDSATARELAIDMINQLRHVEERRNYE